MKKRKPVSTPIEVHNFANAYFEDEFGVPFRNGMFCTGDSTFARDYGNLYLVFPVGNFKYCWSPKNATESH